MEPNPMEMLVAYWIMGIVALILSGVVLVFFWKGVKALKEEIGFLLERRRYRAGKL